MEQLLAQSLKLPGSTTAITGPLKTGKFNTLGDIVSEALNYIFPIAGVLLFFYLVWGGYDYLLSMGDPKKAASGKNKITNAIIGFIIIFMAFWITQLINYLFKLNAL